MIVAYLRVSTDEQDVESQKGGILKYLANRNMSCSVWFEDVAKSGTTDWRRRGLAKVLKKCGNRDIIVVSELSRIARSVMQVFDFLRECKDKGVEVIFVKEGFSFAGGGSGGVQEAMTNILLAVVAGFAEMERAFMSERTREGIKRAARAGKTIGRPQGSKKKI